MRIVIVGVWRCEDSHSGGMVRVTVRIVIVGVW